MQSSVLIIILAVVVGLTPGCQVAEYFQNNPQVGKAIGKTVLNIALRVAVSKLAGDQPGIIPYLQSVSTVLRDPLNGVAPDSLKAKLDDLIARNVGDPIYSQSLVDLSDMMLSFYQQIYDEHGKALADSTYFDIMKAFASSIDAGLAPVSFETTGFYLETQRQIITIE